MRERKLRVERVALVIATIALITEMGVYGHIQYEKHKQVVDCLPQQEVKETYEEVSLKRVVLDLVERIEEDTKQEVYYTNYYIGDGSSTNKTGSGLTTDNFTINENGWYLYQGKVVVACATYEGLESQYGVLKNFNDPNEHISYYHYFDEFTIEIDDKEYKAICLDTCGASMDYDYLLKVDNGLNRIDIFIADKSFSFGKKKGYVKGE